MKVACEIAAWVHIKYNAIIQPERPTPPENMVHYASVIENL